MSEAPTTWPQLRDALQSGIDSWAPGQQRIARLVLDDPQGTAFRPIIETARLAQVHQSSVVRFARTLGLAGYPALVALCRQELTKSAQLVERFGEASAAAESTGLLAATLQSEQENLQRTLSRIDPKAWDKAVRRLDAAERVHIMGLRKCLPAAQLLAYLLRMVRPGVHQVAPLAGAIADELRELRKGDVFVAMSISRYTAATVSAFEAAKRRGAYTVAITDSDASPLARIADTTFLVECEGATVFRSIAGMVVVGQALATAVAVEGGARARDELADDEALLDEFGVYWTASRN